MPNRTRKIHIPHLGESWTIIAMTLIGWSCYSFADMSIKMLVSEYSIWQIMATGSGSATLVLGTWVLIKYGWRGFIPETIGWHIARTVIGAFTALTIVNALARIPMADVYGFTFSAPFFTLILIHFVLKEHVGWHRWSAVAVGFTGVIILAGPKFADFNIGYVLAFLAMITMALSTIVLRKVGKNDPPALYALYPLVAVFCIVFPLSYNELQAPQVNDLWKFAIQIGALIGGLVLVSMATVKAKQAAAIAPFVYVQIIWATLFGYFIFNDPLKPESLIGLPLIIGAGLYMIYREKKVKKIKN
jgi:S-adenosylmethionine uptake transporter